MRHLLILFLVTVFAVDIALADPEYLTYRGNGCELILSDTNWVLLPEINSFEWMQTFAARNTKTDRTVFLLIIPIGESVSLGNKEVMEGFRNSIESFGGRVLEETNATLHGSSAKRLLIEMQADGQRYNLYGYGIAQNGYIYQLFVSILPGQVDNDEALHEVIENFQFVEGASSATDEEIDVARKAMVDEFGETSQSESLPHFLGRIFGQLLWIIAIIYFIRYMYNKYKKA